jgi:dTDP-4-dehydrorhamnose reductase
MKTLVIGASGQVGSKLLGLSKLNMRICQGTYFKHYQPDFKISSNGWDQFVQLDIRDTKAVEECIKNFEPEVIFLPGALTFVDYCETHRDECFSINVDGTANVAHAAKKCGAPVVFFSTEHVFSDSPDAYPENARPAAKSVYAQSKVLAEVRLRDIIPDAHLILRASWVFGPESQRKNFVYRAVKTLRAGERLQVPHDQYGQPTFSVDLAETALALLKQNARGTFHAVGPAHVTRLAFAQLIAKTFDLNPALIDGIDTASLKQPAPRPLFIQLRRDKLTRALGRDPIRSPEAVLIAMRDGAAEFRP